MHNWKSDMSRCIITIKEGAAFTFYLSVHQTRPTFSTKIYCSITCLNFSSSLLSVDQWWSIIFSLEQWISIHVSHRFIFNFSLSLSFYCINKQNERIVIYVMFMGLCLSIENTSRELTASSYHSFSERLRTKSSVSN